MSINFTVKVVRMIVFIYVRDSIIKGHNIRREQKSATFKFWEEQKSGDAATKELPNLTL